MWFRRRSNGKKHKADLRDTAFAPSRQPILGAKLPEPLVDSKEFADKVLPEIIRRWEAHCFCENPQFLKLISFDFHDYHIAPTMLIDTDRVVGEIIMRRFRPVDDWMKGHEGSTRTFCCPQCSCQFKVWGEDYSIAMWVHKATPTKPIDVAEIGRFAAGYYIYSGQEHELSKITDFRPAESIETFLGDLTTLSKQS